MPIFLFRINMPKLVIGDRLESGRFLEVEDLHYYLGKVVGLKAAGAE